MPPRGPVNEYQILGQNIKRLEEDQHRIADHFTGWISSIDAISFAAIFFYLHPGEPFKLNDEVVKEVQDFIEENILKEMDQYREMLKVRAEEQAKKEEKKSVSGKIITQ